MGQGHGAGNRRGRRALRGAPGVMAVLSLLLAGSCADISEPAGRSAPPDSSRSAKLRVEVVTTGVDLDRDGYVIELTPEAGQMITEVKSEAIINGSGLVTAPKAIYYANLVDVADNCFVDPLALERRLILTSDDDVTITFKVTCLSIPPGQGLEVSIVTMDADVGPRGYTMEVVNDRDWNLERFDKRRAVSSNGPYMVPSPTGAFLVILDGAGANCVVSPSTTVAVSVRPMQTTPLAFRITCIA
jgi:hypothetical protein